MFSDDIARKIVADHHAAPKPLAGAWDKDADLVRRISAALEKQETDIETQQNQIANLFGDVEQAKGTINGLRQHLDELRAVIRKYADTLDTETFGAGLALPADLHAVAESLRMIIESSAHATV